jgi:class 3 adenylate cyclase
MGKSALSSIVPASLRLRDDWSSNRGTQHGKNAASDLAKGPAAPMAEGDHQRLSFGVPAWWVVVGDLIGMGAAQEAAVVGETPNLAARLQAREDDVNGRVGVSGDDIIHEVEEFDAPPTRLVRGSG